jgi:hypothetical protein
MSEVPSQETPELLNKDGLRPEGEGNMEESMESEPDGEPA